MIKKNKIWLYLSHQNDLCINIFVTIVLFFFVGIYSLFYTFGQDQGIYSYVASALLNGKTLYKDIFAVKPPLTFLVYALSFKLFGHSIMAIRIFDFIWQCSTALVILLIANKLYKRKYVSLLVPFLYGLFYYSYEFSPTAQTDGFINFPLSLSILQFLLSLENNKKINWVMSGFFLSIAGLFKYPIMLIIVFYVLIIFKKNDEKSKIFPKIIFLVTGFCIPFLIFLIFLIINDMLKEFLYIQYTYMSNYNFSGNIKDRINKVFKFSSTYSILRFSILFLMCELFYVYHKRLPITSYIMVFWSITTLFHLIIQNQYYGYHTLPIIAPSVLIAFHMVVITHDVFLDFLPKLRYIFIGSVVLFLCLLYVSLGNISKINIFFKILWEQKNSKKYYETNLPFAFGSMKTESDISKYIMKNSNKEDTIFIWGYEPSIYFLSERDCASRFIYSFPIYGCFSWKQRFTNQLMEELNRNKPQFILIQKNDSVPWVSGTTDDSERAFKKITPLYNFVTKKYNYDKNIHNFIIYRAK